MLESAHSDEIVVSFLIRNVLVPPCSVTWSKILPRLESRIDVPPTKLRHTAEVLIGRTKS